MKCVQFYCNKRYRNENQMHLSRLYDQAFVTYILQMFNEDIVSGPADIMSLFNFSPHVFKQVVDNCSHCISYPPARSGKVVANGAT
jgi:hypothetical protein